MKNFVDLPRSKWRNILLQTKIFFSASTSEASGSLLEAITVGAYPIVAKECHSSCLIVDKLGGFKINTASPNSDIADIIERILLTIDKYQSPNNRERLR